MEKMGIREKVRRFEKTRKLGQIPIHFLPRKGLLEVGEFHLKLGVLIFSETIVVFGALFILWIKIFLGTGDSVDLSGAIMLVITITTVLHSSLGEEWETWFDFFWDMFLVFLVALIFIGILYLGDMKMFHGASDKIWLFEKIVFAIWMFDYIFVLRLRKVNE